MTTGELLNLMEESARAYRRTALESIVRNRHMNELTTTDMIRIGKYQAQNQRLVDAILVDFINHVALERGGNRGEQVKHVK